MVETKIVLSGNTVKLKYPNSAVRQIDKALGFSALTIIERANQVGMASTMSLDTLATIIWGGRLHLHNGETVDHVADMIPLQISELTDVAHKVLNIIMDIYGIDDAETEVDVKPGKGKVPNGTGKRPKNSHTDTSD